LSGAKGDTGLASVDRPVALNRDRLLNHAEKNGEKWRFFGGEKRHFSVFEAGAAKHTALIWKLLCRPVFLAPKRMKNVGRHFPARTLSM
jgi:hypothetical protein